MKTEETKIDLRRVARSALAEAGLLAEAADGCDVPIEDCRSKKGPAGCRIHCVKYLDNLRDGVTFEEAVVELKEKFGIECVKRKYATRLIKDKDIIAFLDGRTKPISEEDYQLSVRSLWVCLDDMAERFPRIKIPQIIFVGAEPKGKHERGAGSVDAIWTTATFITFNSQKPIGDYNHKAYGHKDARLPYDVIRHEIGHNIMTFPVAKAWLETLKAREQEVGTLCFENELREKISDYACNSPDRGFDSFAEAFSKYTSNDYSLNLPEWADEFLTKLIGTR